MPQLAHAGIDQRNTGAPLLPAFKQRFVRRIPVKAIEARIEVFRWRFRKVIKQVIGKLAPAQFTQIRLDIRPPLCIHAFDVLDQGEVDLPR